MPPNTWIAVSPTEASRARERLGAHRGEVPLGRLGRVGGPQRVDDAAAREFDRLVHVDAQMLDGLEAADRLVELPAHLRVVDGQVHHRGRGTERVGGARDDDVVDERLDGVGRARRPTGVRATPSRTTSNSLRVGSTWDRAVTVTPSRGGVDGVERGAVRSVGEHQQHVGRGDVGHGGHLAAQRPRHRQRAAHRSARRPWRSTVPSAIPASSPPSAPVRVSARVAATALDNHGPG